MSDGSIVISTKLDNAQLERDFSKLKKEIEKLEQTTADQEAKKAPLVVQAQELEARMREARAEVERYRTAWAAGVAGADKEQSAAITKAQQLEAEHAKVVAQIDKIDAKLQPAYEKTDALKDKAGGVARELAKAGVNTERMGGAVKKAEKSMDRFKMRLREVVRSALVFTLITQALAKFRGWMGKIVKANGEASAAVARLKGALLTLAQPLVDIIVPAFAVLVNVLTRVVSTFAQLFSMLTGRSIKSTKDAAKALDKETAALEGTGAAADDAGKALAGFDEINMLSDGAGGKGASGGGAATAPDFGFEADLTEGRLKNILGLVEAIGSAFLAWRISKALGLNLGQTLALAAAIYSAIQFVKNVFDAWTNGINWDNLLGMLVSAAGLAVGLGIALGPVAAGISLIATGLTMLVTGFHDAFENGWNLQNLLTSMAGILATGIGISLLTGSFIPALVAGIASILLAITVAYGHGEELLSGVKVMLQGFIDFFKGIFTGDIELAIKGIGEIFSGLKTAVFAIVDSLRNMLLSFLDWLDEKTGGRFHGIIEFAKKIITGFFNWVKEAFGNIADSIQQIFEGVITFLSGVFTGDWDKAWEGVKDIFKGFVNLLIGLVESFVNFFVRAINAVIDAANKLSFTAPDWLGGGTFGINIQRAQELHIPRLAQGAVIPPNREFLAVLGDQKSGTNVEAPISTIEAAVTRGIQRAGGAGGAEFTITIKPAPGFTRYLSYELDDESRRRGAKLVRV